MQFEFVFTKPCECLENALYGTIERFLTFEILRAEEVKESDFRSNFFPDNHPHSLPSRQSTFSRDDRWARRFATGFDSEDDDDFVPYRKCPTYKVGAVSPH